MQKTMILLFIVFLFCKYAVAMEKPRPWYKTIFNSKNKKFTPAEKAIQQNQEWITLIGKSWKNKILYASKNS